MKLNVYIVAHLDCPDKVVNKLSEDERKYLKCYLVNAKLPKSFTRLIDNVFEFKLKWYDPSYQNLQYYETSLLPHLVMNKELSEDLSHFGMIHYDVIFQNNSVNKLIEDFEKEPDQIQFTSKLKPEQLYLTKPHLDYLGGFLSDKLNIKVNTEYIWKNGFIGCTKSIAPLWVYKKFGKFMIDNKEEIENIVRTRRVGTHKMAGFQERLWGFYLMSLELPYKQINSIACDWTSYKHNQYQEFNQLLK